MLDDIMYKNNLLYPNFLWFLIKSGEIFLHNPERALDVRVNQFMFIDA